MFSKYDVYTTVQSLYCYPDSDVLKNKLNIRDRDELKRAEEEITALKQYMLMESPIKGRFSKTQLMNITAFCLRISIRLQDLSVVSRSARAIPCSIRRI